MDELSMPLKVGGWEVGSGMVVHGGLGSRLTLSMCHQRVCFSQRKGVYGWGVYSRRSNKHPIAALPETAVYKSKALLSRCTCRNYKT